jgi:hypothetical protein
MALSFCLFNTVTVSLFNCNFFLDFFMSSVLIVSAAL